MHDVPVVPSSSPRGIEIVLGSPAAIEQALLARVSAVRAHDPLSPIDVLVGGVLMRPYLQRLIAEASSGLVNVRFSTLGELGVRLGEPVLAASSRRPIPAMAERAYVAEAARDCIGYFAPVARTPGFAEAARRLLRELRQEGVTPDALAAQADKLESNAKADDLCNLYRRYLGGRAGHYDGVDALAAADVGRFDGIELLVVGIWRLSATARDLVEQIAHRVPVTFFLPSVAPDADEAHADLRAWLTTAGATEASLGTAEPASPLEQLQARLFAPKDAITPDGSIDLVSAPDPLAETKEAARACLAWAADGVPFRQIAVTYRQAEVYRPLVEAVFTEAGIPVYLDDGPSLAERPLGRRILALIDLIESPLRRPDVMAFLSDGRMPRETRERFGGAPTARWDSASRRAGVVQGLDQWRERLSLLRDEERSAAEEEGAPEWLARRVEDDESLIAFMDELGERLARRPKRSSWSDALACLADLLRTYVYDVEDVLGYLETLTQLDSIVPEVDFSRFLEIVRAEVEALKAGDLDEAQQGAFGRRGVNVLDINQLRNLRFDGVCVLGLAERSFPPPPRQDPLLLDDEREALNATGMTLPLRARGADPEPLQFALAVHAARKRLLISTRRADEAGGRLQLPSGFFRAVVSATEGRRVRIDEVERASSVRRMTAGRVGAGTLEAALTLAERDRTLLELEPELGRAMLARLEPRTERSRALREARLRTRSLTEFDGVLTSEEARAAAARVLAEGWPLSPTGLEGYATCPLRYFFSDVLRLRPLEEPAEILELDALDRGRAMHDILHAFVEAVGEERFDARHRTELDAIADRVLADLEARGRTGAALLWTAHRQAILDDLEGWFDRELADPSPYTKRRLEVLFGDPEPVRVSAGDLELRLRGRIDRLDYDDKRFRVVDYKSGRALKGGDGSLAGGTTLQLPLYLLAGAQLVGLDPADGEAAYHYFSRGDFKRVVFTGEHLTARRGELDNLLERIARGISEGDFHAEPDDNACRFCDFDGLCDVGRKRIRERKGADQRITSFAEMREIK